MPLEGSAAARRLGLVDAVDHLLNRGVVLTGNASISLAGVELVYLGLNLYLASTETLRRGGVVRNSRTALPNDQPAATGTAAAAQSTVSASAPAALLAPPAATGDAPSVSGAAALRLADLPEQVAVGGAPDEAASSLAKLVLTLVELLRQVLERQAVRRMEGDGLTDDEVERMGLALMELENKMIELRELFGLEEGDLTLDLGPLTEVLDA